MFLLGLIEVGDWQLILTSWIVWYANGNCE